MIREHYPVMVPGLDTSSEPDLEVRAPFSGDLVARVALLGSSELEQALGQAFALANQDGALPPAHERARHLRRVAELIAERAESLARIIATEGGKPLLDARVEVARAAGTFTLCAEESVRVAGREIPMGGAASSVGKMAFSTREPLGVVVAYSAFNHPLNLLAHQVGPAYAAGCPVLIKPAPATPISCMTLVALMREAGIGESWVVPIPCSNELAGEFVSDARISLFSFIGSAHVGWALRSKLAPGTRCLLEHGGAAPVLVDQGANIKDAARGLLKGGFYHAGQVCVSAQRVFVHRRVRDELIDSLMEGARNLKVGDPLDESVEVGPLIRAREIERINSWAEEADRAGGEIICGGRALGNQCYSPTIIVDPPQDTKVIAQEVCGPVLSVVGAKTLHDAVGMANQRPWSFQAAVFTSDINHALHVAAKLNASAVMINDHSAFRVDWMPFGGYEQSGLGMGGVDNAVRDMTREKLIVFNPSRSNES